MSQIDRNIAYNLKRIRKSRNLSLDMLAEKTGVSKSMLGQIERGESNPTVATVSKIMEGMQVSFEDLIYKKEDEIVSVDRENLSIYKEKAGEYSMQVVFPYRRERSFELFYLRLAPGGLCLGNVYGENTWIYLTVSKGAVNVKVENEEYRIAEGNSLRFPAFKEHSFAGPKEAEAEGYLILSHAEDGA
ncbi:MAG: XRE family transcriptional regulator [Bacillota bacterium]|nr:XRE family transcriptional regulator [Bacillota bacterium]